MSATWGKPLNYVLVVSRLKCFKWIAADTLWSFTVATLKSRSAVLCCCLGLWPCEDFARSLQGSHWENRRELPELLGILYHGKSRIFFEFPINSCHSCWLNLMVKHLNLHYVFLFSYYVIIHISYSILLANLGWWSHLIFQPDWNHESATFSWTILFFAGISIEVCRHQDVVSSDLESVVLRDAVMSRAQLPRFWRP